MPIHSKSSGFRSQVLDWLRGLNDKQFAEVFYEAVASRNTSDLPGWRGHFILADAELDDEALICQSGTCDGCSADIRSWSKRTECPVCGQSIACT